MSFEYEILEDGSIDVTVTRHIKIGQIVRINPSEAFLGIEHGIVEVIAIKEYDELDHTDGNVEGVVELDEDAMNEPWVLYRYKWSDYKGIDKEYLVPFPLSYFINHTMHY
jgi:hypothetical protein